MSRPIRGFRQSKIQNLKSKIDVTLQPILSSAPANSVAGRFSDRPELHQNRGDRVVTALLQGSEHAHQDRLGLGPVLAAVGVAVLSRDFGRSNLSLRVVVVEGNLGMVQESEQLGLVSLAVASPIGERACSSQG